MSIKSIRLIILAALFGLSTSCATTVGVVGGAAMGGTSLTKVLYDSNTSDAFKYVGTVPAFIGGTLTGPFVNLGKAWDMDIKKNRSLEFKVLLDPFNAGLFGR